VTSDELVRSFIADLERADLDAALARVTDDVEYDNVPMSKVFGRDGVRTTLAPFLAQCSEIEWVIHHQAATGDVVMNERTDRFRIGDRWVELGVAGLFVVRNGRIALWRDYFDLATFRSAMAG
jgi:limonene-1,2-epoxide hydrolase